MFSEVTQRFILPTYFILIKPTRSIFPLIYKREGCTGEYWSGVAADRGTISLEFAGFRILKYVLTVHMITVR